MRLRDRWCLQLVSKWICHQNKKKWSGAQKKLRKRILTGAPVFLFSPPPVSKRTMVTVNCKYKANAWPLFKFIAFRLIEVWSSAAIFALKTEENWQPHARSKKEIKAKIVLNISVLQLHQQWQNSQVSYFHEGCDSFFGCDCWSCQQRNIQ